MKARKIIKRSVFKYFHKDSNVVYRTKNNVSLCGYMYLEEHNHWYPAVFANRKSEEVLISDGWKLIPFDAIDKLRQKYL
jgi:hypothetical protein